MRKCTQGWPLHKAPSPWPFPALSLRPWGHRFTGGLCCGFCPPPTGCSETHPVLCYHVSSAGPGQQCTDAGRYQRVITKTSHTYPVTKPHANHTCSTMTLWTWQHSLGQLLTTLLSSRHAHTAYRYTQTHTNAYMHTHIYTNTRTSIHTQYLCACTQKHVHTNTLMSGRETPGRVVTDDVAPGAAT